MLDSCSTMLDQRGQHVTLEPLAQRLRGFARLQGGRPAPGSESVPSPQIRRRAPARIGRSSPLCPSNVVAGSAAPQIGNSGSCSWLAVCLVPGVAAGRSASAALRTNEPVRPKDPWNSIVGRPTSTAPIVARRSSSPPTRPRCSRGGEARFSQALQGLPPRAQGARRRRRARRPAPSRRRLRFSRREPRPGDRRATPRCRRAAAGIGAAAQGPGASLRRAAPRQYTGDVNEYGAPMQDELLRSAPRGRSRHRSSTERRVPEPDARRRLQPPRPRPRPTPPGRHGRPSPPRRVAATARSHSVPVRAPGVPLRSLVQPPSPRASPPRATPSRPGHDGGAPR